MHFRARRIMTMIMKTKDLRFDLPGLTLGRFFIRLIVCAIAGFLAADVIAQEPLISIKEVAWTNNVDKGSRQIGQRYEGTAPNAPLYLWMRVTGKESALAQLKQEGKLPIRHKWFLERRSGITGEGVTKPLDEITIPAGTNDFLDKLQFELTHRGFFDWRTWSMKENIQIGVWRVGVVYADNTPVLCGDNNAPCEFTIRVK